MTPKTSSYRRATSGRSLPALAALLLGVVGVAIFAHEMNLVYPIRDWLSVHQVTLWGWVLLFNLACLSFGQAVLIRVLRITWLPPVESAVFGMTIGTVAFGLAMYVVGALALFRPSVAIALPLLFLLVGGYDGVRLIDRCMKDIRSRPYSTFALVVGACGVVCVALVYLGVMTPDSVNYDSSWYHLRIAEDYARWGRIGRFTDYNANVPHLASIFYTWGYLVPGLGGAERWIMALHLEFSLFLWTLAGVTAGIQRAVGDYTLRSTWPTFFLFPIIFVYDNNLGAAADHVVAFYSVPAALATFHVLRGFGGRRSALLAIALAGAALTKYQAIYLILPVAAIVGIAWLRAWLRLDRRCPQSVLAPLRRTLWRSPIVLLGLGALLVSPHFIKNLVFFHNPVYPFLQHIIPSRPTVPDANLYVQNVFTDNAWIPKGSFWKKVEDSVKLFLTFSFVPHYSFARNVPVFGSLFTLLLPGLALVPRRHFTAIMAGIGSAAILIWGMTYRVDRNLQTFMPLLVCATGALIVKLWQLGWIARLGLVPLVALQMVWGADAPFYAGKPGLQGIRGEAGSFNSGFDRIQSAVELIRSGIKGRGKVRFDNYRRDFVSIGNAIPEGAKVLFHASHISLGINRDLLQDMQGFQGLITYDNVQTPRELYDYFHSLGITHLLEGQGIWESSRQEQVIYNLFVKRYGESPRAIGGYRLATMPRTPPPAEAPYQVLCLSVPGYQDGLYPIGTLNGRERIPRELQHFSAPARPLGGLPVSELLTGADAVLASASRADNAALAGQFELIPSLGDIRLYARRRQ